MSSLVRSRWGFANTSPALSMIIEKFSVAAIFAMIFLHPLEDLAPSPPAPCRRGPAGGAGRSAAPSACGACSSASFSRTLSGGSNVRFLSRSSMSFFSCCLLLVQLLLLLVEHLLEVGLRLAAVLGLVEGALHVDVAELQVLGEQPTSPTAGKTASNRNRDARDIMLSPSPAGCLTPEDLEKVADRELEDDGLLAGERPERDAPLEAQRTDGREPAEPEAPAGAVGVDVERASCRGSCWRRPSNGASLQYRSSRL